MHKVKIIGEAGVNHNGDIEMAKRLIDAAAEAGVDIVKFQTFKASDLVTAHATKADYQSKNTGENKDQLSMLQSLELSAEDHIVLLKYCKLKNIQFLSTAFDLDSIQLLKKLQLKIGKIPSGEITNLPYLRNIARTFPEIILSTGMSTMDEVEKAIAVIVQEGIQKENITVLHCNTEYPTPMQDVNLRAMKKMGDSLGVSFGYSDHTQGIEVAIAAVALGAIVIEKHFTLDKNLPGPDHKASLEPHELIDLVKSIRNIELALGSENKQVTPSEKKNILIARKSIVAKKYINVGEILTEENLSTKRPGSGINPMQWDNLIGTKAIREFQADELIER